MKDLTITVPCYNSEKCRTKIYIASWNCGCFDNFYIEFDEVCDVVVQMMDMYGVESKKNNCHFLSLLP